MKLGRLISGLHPSLATWLAASYHLPFYVVALWVLLDAEQRVEITA
jgi:hypothetical protein